MHTASHLMVICEDFEIMFMRLLILIIQRGLCYWKYQMGNFCLDGKSGNRLGIFRRSKAAKVSHSCDGYQDLNVIFFSGFVYMTRIAFWINIVSPPRKAKFANCIKRCSGPCEVRWTASEIWRLWIVRRFGRRQVSNKMNIMTEIWG